MDRKLKSALEYNPAPRRLTRLRKRLAEAEQSEDQAQIEKIRGQIEREEKDWIARAGEKRQKARLGTLPKSAQKLWVERYDVALDEHDNKGVAAAIAWSAVKRHCKKDYLGIWECEELDKKDS